MWTYEWPLAPSPYLWLHCKERKEVHKYAFDSLSEIYTTTKGKNTYNVKSKILYEGKKRHLYSNQEIYPTATGSDPPILSTFQNKSSSSISKPAASFFLQLWVFGCFVFYTLTPTEKSQEASKIKGKEQGQSHLCACVVCKVDVYLPRNLALFRGCVQ